MPGAVDDRYVTARRTLLTALEALRPHLEAVVLVGAQAIYLHTGEADLAVAPFTIDADLSLDPAAMPDDPLLADLMAAAKFLPTADPGRWVDPSGVSVDLMVPEALAGPGRRGADLGVHGRRVARRARGLEACLVDRAPAVIEALEAADTRHFRVSVAGPSGLLVAKIIKINERVEEPGRSRQKDALDVVRILRAIPTETLTTGLAALQSDPRSAEVTSQGLEAFRTLFGNSGGLGVRMAVAAVVGLEDPDTLAASTIILASDLMLSIDHRR
ncbi:MAG: hypothetical protein JW820_00985 [Spirochaetales bacterium]|nr:hypothetical protein [Spirochaetales bacterium]